LFRYVAVECILTFVSLQLGRSVDDYAGNLYMSSSTDTTSCISLVRLSSDHGGELAANKGRLSGRVGRTPASRRLQRAQLCAAPRRLSNNARQPLDPPPTGRHVLIRKQLTRRVWRASCPTISSSSSSSISSPHLCALRYSSANINPVTRYQLPQSH